MLIFCDKKILNLFSATSPNGCKRKNVQTLLYKSLNVAFPDVGLLVYTAELQRRFHVVVKIEQYFAYKLFDLRQNAGGTEYLIFCN